MMREVSFIKPGNIILLNGTSSSGKTTLAKVLQKRMQEPYLHLGNDQFLQSNWPENLLMYSDGTDSVPFDGWLAVFRDNQFVDLKVGPTGLRWLTGMYKAMAAWSETGNHLVADLVLHDERILQAAASVFYQLPVWFISVYCPLEIAEKREQERSERRATGGARLFYQGVYKQGIADLVVNTAENSPEACAEQIEQYMQSGKSPNAFRQLHQHFVQLKG